MNINMWGTIVWESWHSIPDYFPHVEIDAFVVMPNHVHGIILIVDDPQPKITVGAMSASLLPLRTKPQGGK